MTHTKDELQIQQQLIILTLVNKLKDPSQNELMDLALKSMYMDYFAFQTHFDNLLKSSFIKESLRKSETRLDAKGKAVLTIDITDEGLDLLNNMRDVLSIPVRKYVNDLLESYNKEKKENDTISANYKISENGNYIVKLQYVDGKFEHFTLELTTSNESRARKICNKFKENPSSIYLATLSIIEEEINK